MTNRHDDGPATTVMLILAAAACGFLFGLGYGAHHSDVFASEAAQADGIPDASHGQYEYRDLDSGATALDWDAAVARLRLSNGRRPQMLQILSGGPGSDGSLQGLVSPGYEIEDAAATSWRRYIPHGGDVMLDEPPYTLWRDGWEDPCVRGCMRTFDEAEHKAVEAAWALDAGFAATMHVIDEQAMSHDRWVAELACLDTCPSKVTP